jgi:hypothetical protein
MPKLWQQTAAASLAVLMAILVPVSVSAADSKPFFQTQFAGPFAGGSFDNGSPGTCRGSADYQSPYPSGGGTPDYYKGAIMAFGTVSGGARQGAHSNLDAYALGKIEGPGPAGAQYGFYTGNGSSSTGGLSFANSSSGISDYWGGNLEGLLSYSHCIPDYYGTKSGSATQTRGGGTIVSNGSTKTINAGGKEIIFVNGNAYIGGNIEYASHDATNIPKFALVVKGNIYIGPGVDRLDGWYIAQPDGSNSGEFWTCHDGSNKPTDQWMRVNCDDNRLTINGAVTAAHVYLGRISGSVGGPAAETVNFTPDMVLGGPFFDETSAGSGSTGAIQSLISLPPIF